MVNGQGQRSCINSTYPCYKNSFGFDIYCAIVTSFGTLNQKSCTRCISAILKVPDGTFSWKWFKSLTQRSDLNLVGSTWLPK